MITVDELAQIPLFACLAPKELEYLARTVPDIRLVPGEYIAHEGDSRSLFVIVDGQAEVTKLVDGVERVLGPRGPGSLFGEVPMIFDTPFPAGLRAAEPTRLIRLDVKVFHTIAAAHHSISATVGAIALSRIEGLRELAEKPPEAELTFIGPRVQAEGHALRTFLDGNQTPFDWLTPDEVEGAHPPYPIVRLRDGRELVRPTLREVAAGVGLTVSPSRDNYDVVVIGSGPAGLAAAVYGVSEGLSTLLIERDSPGGQAGTSSRIENYLGFPFGVSGDELAGRALNQAKRLGAEVVVTRSVEKMDAGARTLTLDGGEVIHARSMVLAMGVAWRRMAIPSLDRLTGKGVYYGAARGEAGSTQGKDIFLIGAGNSSGQAAIYFASYARTVTLLCRGGDLTKSMSHYLIEQMKTKSNIRVELQSEVVAVHGGETLEALDVVNGTTGKTDRRGAAALFIMIGADASTEWLPPAIARDANGFILTGPDAAKPDGGDARRDPYILETSAPGIFAVGDVRAGSVKRIASGVGEGSMAIAFVHRYLAE